jgi:hypothetical protein
MLDALNWAEVEPAIFGTLFEGILDPGLRKKLGARYTSRTDIELIVEPVLMAPLRREWDDVKRQVNELLDKAETKANSKAATTKRVRSLIEDLSPPARDYSDPRPGLWIRQLLICLACSPQGSRKRSHCLRFHPRPSWSASPSASAPAPRS